MLQRSILYTLASFGRITAPHFLSMHMCKLSIQTLSTYVGGAMLPIQIHETCPNPFTNGKHAWARNMDSKLFFNSYLCEGCHQLLESGD
jgi:hypothetical protein